MADRQTTITLKVNDQYSDPLNKFAAGMDDAVAATSKASKSLDEHTAKQETLHEALGTSRRETQLLTGTVLNLAGATPQATQAIEAFASGMTGIGLVAVVASAALTLGKQAIDDHVKSLREDAAQMVEAGTPLKIYSEKTKELRIETGLLTAAQDVMSKGVGAAAYNFAITATSMDKAAAAELAAANNLKEGLGNAARMDDYNAGQKKTEQAAYDLGLANFRLGETFIMVHDDALEAQNALTRTQGATNALQRATDDLNASIRAGRNEPTNPNEPNKETIDANNRFYDDQARRAEQAKSQAESLGKSIAALNKQFSDEGAAAIAVYGDKAAAAFGAINASALDTQHKLQAFSLWERNNLPANIQQKITAYLAVNGDALLMKLLGMKGGGGGTGHQQGDEYNFTLEGEDYSVRAAYMNMYHDYGTANAAWEKDHRAELAGQGVTGAGQANTQTGEVYQYAMGVHETVTAPRTMTVGERGPERVDVTPGGAGGMGGNIITINWSSMGAPSAFEVQQMARRLKQAMANDGA